MSDESTREVPVCPLCGGDGIATRFGAGPNGEGDGSSEQYPCPYLAESVAAHPGSENHETYLNIWRALDDLARSLKRDLDLHHEPTPISPVTHAALARALDLGAGHESDDAESGPF